MEILSVITRSLQIQRIETLKNIRLKVRHFAFNLSKTKLCLAISVGSFKFTETVVWRCSVKNVFLKISQNSQENTCTRVSFLINF